MDNNKFKTYLKEKISKRMVKRFSICFGCFFLPVVQLYSVLVALPLFFIPIFRESSDYMEYTFGYFYPISWITVLIFGAYYFLFFFIIENPYNKKSKDNEESN